MTNRVTENRSVPFFNFFAHAIRHVSPLGIYDPLSMTLWGSRTDTGAEIGIRIGGMRLGNGLLYSGGMAYDIMPEIPDGFRLFVNLGISLGGSAKKP